MVSKLGLTKVSTIVWLPSGRVASDAGLRLNMLSLLSMLCVLVSEEDFARGINGSLNSLHLVWVSILRLLL